MALTFRWYLGLSSRWANAGEPTRQVDYQVWCGPAMGAFNEWTKGSFLEQPGESAGGDVALAAPAARRGRCDAGSQLAGNVRAFPLDAVKSEPVEPPEAATSEDLTILTHHPITPTPAIVGIGCLFPKADGPGAYWANIKNKVDGIGPVPPTHWNPADYFDADPKRADFTYAQRGGFLEPVPFNPAEWGIAPNDLEATDTSQLLGLVAARMALDDAGVRRRATATSAASASSSASPARWNWSSRSAPGSAIRSGAGR